MIKEKLNKLFPGNWSALEPSLGAGWYCWNTEHQAEIAYFINKNTAGTYYRLWERQAMKAICTDDLDEVSLFYKIHFRFDKFK